MYSFLAIIVQMGYDQKDMVKAYWSTEEQSSIPFYEMKQDRLYHIVRFLHFSDNKNSPDKADDRVWKMRTIFDKLSDSYVKHYSPSEHLVVDAITVLFQDMVIFKQISQRNTNGLK